MRAAVIAVAAAALLAACGEKPQGTSTAVRKTDAHAFQGANDNGYVAAGWKAGDKASWEEQMRARARAQNEHVRIGGK